MVSRPIRPLQKNWMIIVTHSGSSAFSNVILFWIWTDKAVDGSMWWGEDETAMDDFQLTPSIHKKLVKKLEDFEMGKFLSTSNRREVLGPVQSQNFSRAESNTLD